MRRSLFLTILAVLVVGLSACSDPAREGVATLTGTASEKADASESAKSDPEEAMLAFTQCMREEGIDMPDPEPGGVGITVDARSGLDPQSPKFKAAEEQCRPLLDEALSGAQEQIDPEERARMQEAMLAFAQCMRDQGVDYPDPQVDANGVMRIGPADGADPNDPALRTATEACRDKLPQEESAPGGRP